MTDLIDAIRLTEPDEKKMLPTGSPILTAEIIEQFEKVADGYRETLRKVKVATAEKLYGKDSPQAQSAALLGLRGDTNPFKYVKYAFDKTGRLSLGKGRGRLRKRTNAADRLYSQRTNEIIQAEFAKLNATLNGAKPANELLLEVLNRAMRKAKRTLKSEASAKRKKVRKAQSASRKINWRSR